MTVLRWLWHFVAHDRMTKDAINPFAECIHNGCRWSA